MVRDRGPRDQKGAGFKPQESSDSLFRKAQDLQARRDTRLALLDQQAQLATEPPHIITAALVLPLAMVDSEIAADAPIRAREMKAVERRGVELLLAVERALDHEPQDRRSTSLATTSCPYPAPAATRFRIEVKARIEGAEDFYVTHSELLTSKNAAPHYRLAW